MTPSADVENTRHKKVSQSAVRNFFIYSIGVCMQWNRFIYPTGQLGRLHVVLPFWMILLERLISFEKEVRRDKSKRHVCLKFSVLRQKCNIMIVWQ